MAAGIGAEMDSGGMSDSRNLIALVNGPYAGTYPAAELNRYGTKSVLKIPVDAHFILTDKEAFAFAVYHAMNIPSTSEGVHAYWFRHFEKAEEGPFMVEFVNGPLAGMRPFHQPVLGLPELVIVPVSTELAKDQEGRQRVFAVYKNGAHLGGDHKLIYDGEHRDVVTDIRIIFELTGGPYDGVTYDTDAGILDPGSAFWASGNYTVTDKGAIGKRFMVMAPHFWQGLKEFGGEAVKHAGPIPMHLYEVFDKIEEPYEVYVRAAKP